MKKLFAATALALSLATVGISAHAASTPLVFSDEDGTGSGYTGGNFSSKHTASTFSNSYSFTVSTAFDFSALVSTIALNSTSKLTLTGFSLSDPTAASTYTGTSSVSADGSTAYSFALNNLAAGNYTLTVTGDLFNGKSGAYSLSYNVSAVPEASTTGMMLGGLALVGMVAWRRRRGDQQGKQFTTHHMATA